jgi:hypothetical protein
MLLVTLVTRSVYQGWFTRHGRLRVTLVTRPVYQAVLPCEVYQAKVGLPRRSQGQFTTQVYQPSVTLVTSLPSRFTSLLSH